MQLSKESVRSGYLPKVKLKQGWHTFTVEVQINSPSMDMNLGFKWYSWCGPVVAFLENLVEIERGSSWKVLPDTRCWSFELKQPNGLCKYLHGLAHTVHVLTQGLSPCENNKWNKKQTIRCTNIVRSPNR
jgi:hypothetical protein